MAGSLVNLGAIVNLAADKKSFGFPEWTALDKTTAAALSGGPAGVSGVQHFLTHAQIGYSAAPVASVITVKDGTTIIWQVEVGAHITGVVDLNFEQRPLSASSGAALSVNAESAGGSIVQTLSASGFSDRQGTQTTV